VRRLIEQGFEQEESRAYVFGLRWAGWLLGSTRRHDSTWWPISPAFIDVIPHDLHHSFRLGTVAGHLHTSGLMIESPRSDLELQEGCSSRLEGRSDCKPMSLTHEAPCIVVA
jgi:hypothetical protein